MGDLTVDASVMESVATKTKSAAAEFHSEPALSGVDGGCFGSDVVAGAFSSSARALDAMIRSLGEDGDTLSRFVRTVVSDIEQAETGLAVKIQ